MNGEHVAAAAIRAGDIIEVTHRHEDGPPCLVAGGTDDGLVAGVEPRLGRLVINWQLGPSRGGVRPRVRGCAVYEPGEHVVRIGHLEAVAA